MARANQSLLDEPTVMFFKDFDNPDYRSKLEYPYSYDPICIFKTQVVPTGSLYTDRLCLWYDADLLRDKMQHYFGEAGDYYSSRPINKIQLFLRDLMNHPSLEITQVEEHCNQATGYPVWFIAYKVEQ